MRRRQAALETQLLKRRLAKKKVDPLDRDQAALAGMIRVEFKQASRIKRQQQQQQHKQQITRLSTRAPPRQRVSPMFYSKENAILLKKVLQEPSLAEQQQEQSLASLDPVSIPEVGEIPDESCYFIPDTLGGGGQFIPVAATELEQGIPSPTMSPGQDKTQSGILDESCLLYTSPSPRD